MPRVGLLALRGVERSPDARAFNAPLYPLSYLGKLIWRLVRESNPRLPARQAGTLAAELTRHRWWKWRGSNPQPAACKAAALPVELHTQ